MEIFGNFGNVIYCDFPMDKQKSWINTSLAYVEFEKLEEADDCVKKMNGGMYRVFQVKVRKIKAKRLT